MKLWRAVSFVAVFVLVCTGCSGKGAGSTLPGPAIGHVAVDSNRANWSATGQDPEAVARSFVLANECDCDQVTVKSAAQDDGRVKVTVRLEGLKDDSVKNMEYLVVVQKTGGLWRVESATYMMDCHRGASPEGSCT